MRGECLYNMMLFALLDNFLRRCRVFKNMFDVLCGT